MLHLKHGASKKKQEESEERKRIVGDALAALASVALTLNDP